MRGRRHPVVRAPNRGLPPRMQGRPTMGNQLVNILGITPAHAGKTRSPPSQSPAPGDHPRACGEDLSGYRLSRVVTGPPPRMRGRPDRLHRGSHDYGTTPAHAGKTRPTTPRKSRLRDHPRACGEDAADAAAIAENAGPPPRMRGRLIICITLLHSGGTTPAHAGKTCRRRLRSSSARDHPRACGEDEISWMPPDDWRGPPPRMRGRQ